ncbi:MAG: S8 family serine peptidase, partial [Candidatus Kapaibacteriota bacterium]
NNQDVRAVPFCFSATSGSNSGQHIDVVAPGELIAGYRHTDGAITNWCGTSQATPIVAGVISQMLTVQPTLTFAEIRTILQTTSVDRVGPPNEDTQGWDMYYGWGRLDADAAVRAAQALRMTSTQHVSVLEPILQGVFPNPTSGEATFTLNLSKAAHVKLTIFTVLGNTLQTLADNTLSMGQQRLVWQSVGLPNGVYGYRLEVNGGAVQSGFIGVIR